MQMDHHLRAKTFQQNNFIVKRSPLIAFSELIKSLGSEV